MFSFDQDTRSAPSGNKTVNAQLHYNELNDRFEDASNTDKFYTFWPASNLLPCCHAMPMEICVTVCDKSDQCAIDGQGLLKVLTTFNNVSVLKSEIKANTPSSVSTIKKNDENGLYEKERDLLQGKDIVKDDQFFQYLAEAYACNKYFEQKYKIMGVMKTEAILEDDRRQASQNCTVWTGGVVDIWHNNTKMQGMIEVGDHLYARLPMVIPLVENNGNVTGLIGESIGAKDEIRFPGTPKDKACVILEKVNKNNDLCHRNFFVKFALDMANLEKKTKEEYKKAISEDVKFKRALWDFEDGFTQFNESQIGMAYSNAMYGEVVRTIISSRALF